MAKYPKEFKRYVERLAFQLRDYIAHQEYELKFEYTDRPMEDSDDGASDTHATINANSTYLSASIQFYPALLEQFTAKKYRDVARTILHEICHLLLEPVRTLLMGAAKANQSDLFYDTVETQTQRIANTVEWGLEQHNSKWWTPKQDEIVPVKCRRRSHE
jgi:hypothetical protein